MRVLGTRLTAALLCTGLLLSARGIQAQQRVSVPADTVVRMRLDQQLSSRTDVEGDRFTASLSPEDRSGFPNGTRFEGVITEVQQPTSNQPGILDARFQRALLPDGQSVTMDGRLTSLAESDVRQTADGRFESRRRDRDFEWKWVGYGAGAGTVLSAILGESILRGALLGGLGGAIYAYIRRGGGGGDYTHVNLSSGTEFGVRLRNAVSFQDRPGYRYALDPRTNDDRSYDTPNVFVDGRQVTFDSHRPHVMSGEPYVPLRPVAQAAGLRLEHVTGADSFTLHTHRGAARAVTGDTLVQFPGERSVRLVAAPMLIDGQVYVPPGYFTRVMDMEANWDRPGGRLELRAAS